MRQKNSAMRFDNQKPNYSKAKCDACAKSYRNPLLATVFLGSETDDYYACPRCLSVAANTYSKQITEDFEKLEDKLIKYEESAISNEHNSEVLKKCAHNLGYLKKRIKNSPIPEECLTCSKMIECMY